MATVKELMVPFFRSYANSGAKYDPVGLSREITGAFKAN